MVSLRGNRFHSSEDMARGEAKQKQTNKQTNPPPPTPRNFLLITRLGGYLLFQKTATQAKSRS